MWSTPRTGHQILPAPQRQGRRPHQTTCGACPGSATGSPGCWRRDFSSEYSHSCFDAYLNTDIFFEKQTNKQTNEQNIHAKQPKKQNKKQQQPKTPPPPPNLLVDISCLHAVKFNEYCIINLPIMIEPLNTLNM